MTAPVQSMTGFASLDGEIGGIGYQLDVRSVNGRSLDIRVRMPNGLDRHEPAVRRALGEVVRRGSITISLTLRAAQSEARYRVNESQLDAYIASIHRLSESGAVAAPRADGLLSLKGVIETSGGDDDVGPLDSVLDDLVTELAGALAESRRLEGGRIVPLIEAQLDEMDRLRAQIDAAPERTLAAMKARLHKQISELLAGTGLSEERLHQEAAVLATKADVREELDRLEAHVGAARELLAVGGPVGRKLDFLTQELNRETNTICAKAPHHAVTALGLELKSVVEQMREQVQNLE